MGTNGVIDLSRNGYLKLNGHTLSIRTRRPKTWPKDGSLPSDIKGRVDLGTDADGNPGKIVWAGGFSLIVR